jgi:hypothetical protein
VHGYAGTLIMAVDYGHRMTTFGAGA